jgi:ribosome maturation factor RimP
MRQIMTQSKQTKLNLSLSFIRAIRLAIILALSGLYLLSPTLPAGRLQAVAPAAPNETSTENKIGATDTTVQTAANETGANKAGNEGAEAANDDGAKNASPSADPAVTNSLKEQINKVIKEKKEQVKNKIKDLSQHKRGFVGQIDRVSEEAITVRHRSGSQVIPLEKSLLLVKNKAEEQESITVDDLAVDAWTAVLGYQIEDDFEPIKVIVSEERLAPQPQKVAIGSVVSISNDELVLKTRKDEVEISFQLNQTTNYQDLAGNEITHDDLFEDVQCLVAGYKDSGDDNDADEAESEATETANHALLVKSLAPVE